MIKKFLLLSLLILVLSDVLISQDTYYFYKGRDYGSEALFNPLSVILNGGFDMMQVNVPRDIRKIPWKEGARNLWYNLRDPFGPINRYGWWKFLGDQVLPVGIGVNDAQYWPNYTLHLVGGGMEYTAVAEWYRYHGCQYPKTMSAITMAAYHIVNEIVENGEYQGDNVDPIADIYIFDIGGIILFSFDNVNKFFAEELNLADWSLQPTLALNNLKLHNNGQFFSIKWKFPFSDHLHLFYFFGTNGVGGLSYKFDDGSAVSAGVGLIAKDVIVLDEKTNKQTLNLVMDFGLFYDRGNSLMAYLAYSRKTDYKVNINIYPGLFKIGSFSPGVWAAFGEQEFFAFGITARWMPLGIGYGSK